MLGIIGILEGFQVSKVFFLVLMFFQEDLLEDEYDE